MFTIPYNVQLSKTIENTVLTYTTHRLYKTKDGVFVGRHPIDFGSLDPKVIYNDNTKKYFVKGEIITP